ncbi:MAG: primosomal protein N' [Gammaproteobacteria bacterium]|nr:primosomal protein N' [Gammaproteobacteria bacterium]
MAIKPGGVVQVAVPAPLRRVFDYRCAGDAPPPGARVRVPFGREGRGKQGRELLGVTVSAEPAQAGRRLKSVAETLDDCNLFGARLLELLVWAARYYHHPLGEALQTALPAALRKGKPLADPDGAWCARAVSGDGGGDGDGDAGDSDGEAADAAVAALSRAPAQRRLYEELRRRGWVEVTTLGEQREALRNLRKKNLVEIDWRLPPRPGDGDGGKTRTGDGAGDGDGDQNRLPAGALTVTLNAQQQAAVDAICGGTVGDTGGGGDRGGSGDRGAGPGATPGATPGFASFLLHGVTGSGKTEVYLEAAKRCIDGGRQALILVPEIALTPQLVARVRARLGGAGGGTGGTGNADDSGEPGKTGDPGNSRKTVDPSAPGNPDNDPENRVAVLHSNLSAEQRYRAWWRARAGRAVAVLGTRSAIFTPLQSPGLIIVDEEHDMSYKQQDGFRYHARDLAIKRASLEGVPVVLGSATPSMETRHNAARGRHRRLALDQRGGASGLPRIALLDAKRHRPVDGISAPLLRAIGERLARREQSIIFLNRRGFAPTAQCAACGWQALCGRCDARLTYHRGRGDRGDHGDGADRGNHGDGADHGGAQFQCHHCGRTAPARDACAECGERILFIGAGTQRLERYLRGKFPAARISRLDRDRVTSQAQLEAALRAIRDGATDIIIGTQLIAKGHDFARVTLVGVVDADQGLYSADFRAPEYLFQQLTQVSGRAGRADAPGEVLVQTAHPAHPTLQTMRRHDFEHFARHCIDERRAADCPPFSRFALWRAESTDPDAAVDFLRYAATLGRRLARGRFDAVQVMDAVVSPMEKRAGRYRAQLLVKSPARGPLHRLLDEWLAAIENDPKSRRARWSIDIDPMEMF